MRTTANILIPSPQCGCRPRSYCSLLFPGDSPFSHESHIFLCNRCAGRIRSASLLQLLAWPSDSADLVQSTKPTRTVEDNSLAPSATHATTAAILRNGYLTHRDISFGQLLAMNLSSRRPPKCTLDHRRRPTGSIIEHETWKQASYRAFGSSIARPVSAAAVIDRAILFLPVPCPQ